VIHYPHLSTSRIVITAPAGNLPAGRIEQAVDFLRAQGFEVRADGSEHRQHGYLAGTDTQRAAALLELVRNPEVDIILAARGGYGTARLLPLLPWQEIAAAGKLLLGYSDLTALQNAQLSCAGLASVSAPMAGTELIAMPDEVTWGSLLPFLRHGFAPASDQQLTFEPEQVLTPGRGEGVLVGGNLSVFTSLFGTPYLTKPSRFVLLLEEQGEYPFRLDRYFRMLANAGWLAEAQGVLLGHFLDCTEPDPDKATFTAAEIIAEYCGELSCPVIQNLPYGHTAPRLSLPIGGLVRIDSDAGCIEVTRQV